MSSWHVHGAPSLFKMLKISKSYQLHKKIEDPVLVALAITWQFQILKLDKETEETLEDIRLPSWQVFKLGEGYLECVASKVKTNPKRPQRLSRTSSLPTRAYRASLCLPQIASLPPFSQGCPAFLPPFSVDWNPGKCPRSA